MRKFVIEPSSTETFVFISDGKALTKSDAALAMASHLRGGWRMLRVFRFVPRFVRDWGYDVFARNRYRWFGRSDTCMTPLPGFRDRFICD